MFRKREKIEEEMLPREDGLTDYDVYIMSTRNELSRTF